MQNGFDALIHKTIYENMKTLLFIFSIEVMVIIAEDTGTRIDKSHIQEIENMKSVINDLYVEREGWLFNPAEETALNRYYQIFNELCSMLDRYNFQYDD